MEQKIPRFCDFDCPGADFPPAETAGICRTMAAVWCKKLDALVNKNTPCEWRKRRGAAKPPGSKKAKMPQARRSAKRTAGRATSVKRSRR